MEEKKEEAITFKQRLRRILLVIAALVGTILVWRGIWEVSENFFSAEASLLYGALILAALGFFARKFLFERIP